MKKSTKRIGFIVLVVLIFVSLLYLDLMLGLSLRYDTMDLSDVIGENGSTLFYRFRVIRIVMTIVIGALMIVQIMVFRPNLVIPLSIVLLSALYIILYFVMSMEIHHVVKSQDIPVFNRAAIQLKEYIDSNILFYFISLAIFLLCRFFLVKQRPNPS